MAQERQGKLKILKELEGTKAALRQALTAKNKAEWDYNRLRQEYASSQQPTNKANQMEELLDEELQCSICNELLIDAQTLNCSHTFCDYCLRQWKYKSEICPLCRQQIKFECQTRIIDSFIESAVVNLSEDLQNRRKEIASNRRAIKRLVTEDEGNPKKRRLNPAATLARMNSVMRFSFNMGEIFGDTYSSSSSSSDDDP